MTDGMRVSHPAPGNLTDWSGQVVDASIQDHFDVGNVLRIQVEQDARSGWIETPYVRVTEVTGDTLVGVVDDPYRGDDREISNGDVFTFGRQDVIEVPTEWPGNESLLPHVELTGDSRMTGVVHED